MVKETQPKTLEEAIQKLGENLISSSKQVNVYGYKPHDKQLMFHVDLARTRLYIGGNRSGKTTGGIIEDIWYATDTHPYKDTPPAPVRGRIVTTDFINGIVKNIIPQLQRWCPSSALRGGSWTSAYDKQERILHFANGSFIELMSYDQDLNKFASVSRHFVHFDEEPPKDIYTECTARLIDTNGDCWLTLTPIDGMTWVYDILYLPGLDVDNSKVHVTQVTIHENPYLSENAVEDYLDSLDDEDERLAREQGKFIQLGGVIYKKFDPKVHVIKPWLPPRDGSWEVYTSLDHGFNAPTAWLWHAVNAEHQVVTFFEHYVSGMTIDEHAAAWHKINKELRYPVVYSIADPSIRNTDPITGTSIHEEYRRYGIPLILGNNDVRAGIVKVARYLKVDPSTGRPNLVITENCTNLVKEFPRYRWKIYKSKRLQADNNVQEQPHKKDDHALDSQRYFIMSRPDLGPTNEVDESGISNPLGAVTGADPFGRNVAVKRRKQGSDFTEGYGNKTTQWEYDEYLGGIQ